MKKLIFLLCFPLVAGAQEVLSGRITDSLGLSVPYVNIGVVGKGKGAISNSKGQYQIDLTGVAPKDSKKNRCLCCFLLHFLKKLFVYQKYFYTFVVKNSL